MEGVLEFYAAVKAVRKLRFKPQQRYCLEFKKANPAIEIAVVGGGT